MPSWPIDRYDHLPESFARLLSLTSFFQAIFVRIESLKLFNLTELDSNFKRSSLALHLAQPSFKIGLAYASSTVKGGSVHEVLGVTAAQADVQVTFEISDFKKADVLDPSWTDPHNLCSNEGASVKGLPQAKRSWIIKIDQLKCIEGEVCITCSLKLRIAKINWSG